MPAVEDFERRLGILKQVEPIIENAVKTLEGVINLQGSPLAPPRPPPPPPPPPAPESNGLDLESLFGQSAAPAEPAPSAGGIDLSQLQSLLGGQAAAPAAEEQPDLS